MMLKQWKQTGFVITLALALAAATAHSRTNPAREWEPNSTAHSRANPAREWEPSSAAERGAVIREAALHSSANASSQKMAQVERGRALTVLERNDSGGQGWAKVSMAADETAKITKEISGWVPAQALITAATANGDQIGRAHV